MAVGPKSLQLVCVCVSCVWYLPSRAVCFQAEREGMVGPVNVVENFRHATGLIWTTVNPLSPKSTWGVVSCVFVILVISFTCT